MWPASSNGDGKLVGRAKECALVERALGQLAGGIPWLTEITGEPGIGKTRMLAELAARAGSQGWLVLSGRATEYDGTTPFAVVVDAFDGWLAGLDPRQLRRFGGAERGVLAGVFPAMAAVAETVEQVTERHRVHRAVRALLERVGRMYRVVLLVDDMHWADPATVELLAHLVRRPPRAPVLLALAYRHRQASVQLLAALAVATATRLELGPLTPQEADELLTGIGIGRSRRRAIYRDSGGNPFNLLATRQGVQHARGETPGRRWCGGHRGDPTRGAVGDPRRDGRARAGHGAGGSGRRGCGRGVRHETGGRHRRGRAARGRRRHRRVGRA